MRNVTIATLLFLPVMLAGAPSRSGAQSLPSKKQASRLLTKAEKEVNLTAPGGSPFHYFAKIHYTAGSFSEDGTYEVLWAATDRFRVEFRLGKLRQSVVVSQGKIYDARNTPAVLYLESRVAALTGLPVGGRGSAQEHIDKVYEGKSGGANLICIKQSANREDRQRVYAYVEIARTVCVDSASDDVVSEGSETTATAPHFRSREVRSSFVKLGALRVPTQLSYAGMDEKLEVRVEKIDPVLHFADGVFAPPAGALSLDWCARPGVEKPKGSVPDAFLLLPGGLTAAGFQASGFHAFYFRVGPDGHIKELAEIHQDGTAQKLDSKSIDEVKLYVNTCGGKAAESERVVSDWGRVQVGFVMPYD